jgi:hypothetical protein
MLNNLPLYVPLLFIVTTVITYFLFVGAARKNNSNATIAIISIVTIIWLAIHATLARTKFYVITDTLPPRFALTIVPPLLFIAILFITKGGERFIDSLSMKVLTLLHVVRVFVELVLWFLFTYKFIPELMTFEGRNYDILAGLTAPFIAYYGFVRKKLSNSFMLIWNIVSLLLLINIVINAVLSTPSQFQQFAFDQPNVAVLHFPFIWLPSFIVPVVLFSHLVLIRRFVNIRTEKKQYG